MRRAVLGSVEFGVVYEESPDYPAEVTDKPVESGANVADHVRPLAISLPISGVVAGPDAAQRLEQLRRYRDEGAVLNYVGRNVFHHCVIQNLKTRHNAQVRDGFSFDIVLRQIRLATRETMQFVTPTRPAPAAVPQAKAVANAGTKQSAAKEADSSQRSSMARQALDGVLNYLGRAS